MQLRFSGYLLCTTSPSLNPIFPRPDIYELLRYVLYMVLIRFLWPSENWV